MTDIRVTIFDDSAAIRDSLSILLSNSPGTVLCGAFPDVMNLRSAIEATRPEVILMDIDMPGLNGIEAVRMIRTFNAEVQILMMTIFDDDDKIFDAICAGANGYLLKSQSLDKILDAIREVKDGGSPMSSSIARKVLVLFQQNNPVKPTEEFHLTAREKDVLTCLVEGDSYKMIADRLEIGYATVNTHVKSIYKKLHVNSVAEAISKAMKNKLTSLIGL